MKKALCVRVVISLLVMIMVVVLLQNFSLANSENTQILKLTDKEYLIYVEGLLNDKFEFALSKNAKDSNLKFINSAKDKEKGNHIAYVDSDLYDTYFSGKGKTFLWVKQGKEYKVEAQEVNLSTTLEEEKIQNLNQVTKKIAVKEGEKITYTITVANTGSAEGTATIKDSIPEGTTFVEGSIKVNDEETQYTAEDLSNGIELEVSAKEEATLSFKVTANADLADETQIKNTATVNDEETNEVETTYQIPMITAIKAVNKKIVKPEEEITYTITVTNTGNAEGTATIKDSIPEETTFVEGSIKVNNEETQYTAEDLANGIELEVSAKGEITLRFKVMPKADLENETKIKNTAIVNDKETNEVETKYQARITKSVDRETVKAGEEITYTITAVNTENVERIAKIKDSIPEGTTFVEGSIKVNDEETQYTVEDLSNGIELEVSAKGEVTVNFKVTANADLADKTQIRNVAIVNDKETNEVETTYQTPVITSIKKVSKNDAKVGEILTYTIEATNSGSIEGIVTIKDSAPEGTTFVPGSIKVNRRPNVALTYENLETVGIGVKVEPGKKVELSFDVKVNKDVEGSVLNTAIVNDKETNEVETKIAIINTVKASSIAGKTINVTGKETITYTLTSTNTGDATGTVKISDKVPEGTVLTGSVKLDGDSKEYTEEELEKGIAVTLEAGETKTITFTVKIKTFTGADEKQITNLVAKQDKEPIEGTTDTVKRPVKVFRAAKNWAINHIPEEKEFRPESVTFELYMDGQPTGIRKVVNESNWMATFENLDVFKPDEVESKEIKYTVREVNREGTQIVQGDVKFDEYYTETQYYDSESMTNVVNFFDFKKILTDITVKKIWANETDYAKENYRPESVKFALHNIYDNDKVDIELTGDKTSDEWSKTIKVPKYSAQGYTNTYYVCEYTKDGTKELSPWYEGTYDDRYVVLAPKKQYSLEVTNALLTNQEIEVIKSVNKTEAEYGDTLTYRISAKNKGDYPTKITIKDNILKDDLKDKIEFVEGSIRIKTNGIYTSTENTSEDLKNGIDLFIPSKETKEIEFKVTVKAKATTLIKNKASYQGIDDETPTDTNEVTTLTEDSVITIPTKISQRDVVLLIDISSSMAEKCGNTTRLEVTKEAAKDFIDKFLPGYNKNRLTIIAYDGTANVRLKNSTDAKLAKSVIDNLRPEFGTNIDRALTDTYEYIAKNGNFDNTSVILMTDGFPQQYIREDRVTITVTKDYTLPANEEGERLLQETKEYALKLKEKGTKVYTVIFAVDHLPYIYNNPKERIRKMFQEMCSNSADCVYTYHNNDYNSILPVQKITGTETQYYYEANTASQLSNAFYETYKAIDGQQTNFKTKNGIATIDHSIVEGKEIFVPGQNVEIYVGDYKEGAIPNERYTWSEFIGLSKYVTYDSTKKQIKFNLLQYMTDKNISADKKVYLRFV